MNLALAYYKTAQISGRRGRTGEGRHSSSLRNRQAVFLLADCDLRLGENKKVIELLSPLEKESPNDKALIYLLGTALIRDNQPARGQVLVDRILRDGESAEARLLLGTTKMNAQDFAEALVDLKKAAELNPQLPDVFSYYGMALLSTGDVAAAAERLPQGTGVQSQRFRFQPATGRRSSNRTSSTTKRRACFRAGAASPAGRSRRALPDGHARPDRRKFEQACSKLEQLIKEIAAVRGGARLAGDGLLPAETQGGWRPRARHRPEAERRKSGRRSPGPRKQ